MRQRPLQVNHRTIFFVGNINVQILVMITKKFFTTVVSRLMDQYEKFNQTRTQTSTSEIFLNIDEFMAGFIASY